MYAWLFALHTRRRLGHERLADEGFTLIHASRRGYDGTAASVDRQPAHEQRQDAAAVVRANGKSPEPAPGNSIQTGERRSRGIVLPANSDQGRCTQLGHSSASIDWDLSVPVVPRYATEGSRCTFKSVARPRRHQRMSANSWTSLHAPTSTSQPSAVGLLSTAATSPSPARTSKATTRRRELSRSSRTPVTRPISCVRDRIRRAICTSAR